MGQRQSTGLFGHCSCHMFNAFLNFICSLISPPEESIVIQIHYFKAGNRTTVTECHRCKNIQIMIHYMLLICHLSGCILCLSYFI
jgi:hypothetical protein